MLDRLQVQNFQPHRKRTLHFTDGMNSIVGESDVGKSSCYRAIRWVAANRPIGDEVVSHGETTCRAMIVTRGHKVQRMRTPDENGYKLGKKAFLAIDKAVPPEIQQALMLGDVNFQAQRDAPFWFGLSAPERSRQFNEIVDLTLIDTTLSFLSSAAKKQKTVVEVSQDRLKVAETTAEGLQHVPKLLEAVQGLEAAAGTLGTAMQDCDTLRETLDAAVTAGKNKKVADDRVTVWESLITAVEAHTTAVTERDAFLTANRTVADLTERVSRKVPDVEFAAIEEAAAALKTAKSVLVDFQTAWRVIGSIRIQKLPEVAELEALERAANTLKTLQEDRATLASQLQRVLKLREAVTASEVDVSKWEEHLRSVPVCPKCQQPIQGDV